MGAVPSTPRRGSRPREAAEFLIGALVGNKPYPLTSDIWQKLLEVPLTLQWSQDRILYACEMFAQNNFHTRHLAKILVHLVWSLQESLSAAASSSVIYSKAINAAYMSSTFLKYLIENAKVDNFEDLYLAIDEGETKPEILPKDETIPKFVMRGLLTFLSTSEVSPQSCLLHHELLNFMLVAMSTQLCSAPTPGPSDVHPLIDEAMVQESALICSVVRRLLVNYITRQRIPFSGSSYPIFSEEIQPGVLQRVWHARPQHLAQQLLVLTPAFEFAHRFPSFGSSSGVALPILYPMSLRHTSSRMLLILFANFVLLPYYTFNYLVSSSAEGSRNLLADNSLLLLLILVHYQKCVLVDEPVDTYSKVDAASYIPSKDKSYFSDNPYCKALENARDIEFDRLDVEGNAQSGPLVRVPFASLFDTLGLCLSDESSALLLYSLVHGNSDFLEYVLVRTDLDTLLMPILETLYNASRQTSNQIYMLLIILLILSQDSSFNTSIHKLILPNVPWYQERLLHNTSLGSLMVIILIRTVKYNLSKLRDVYLHTNCLATLANMAPHVHRLSGYASQRLVSLFDMLARKYTKLVEFKNDKSIGAKGNQVEGASTSEDVSAELQIYTDFLRIVLEILNAILTYALPRNPEVVYAIMHRQEVFQPFKNHPRFNELLENIYTVLDFFNSRMDMQRTDGEWSVDKVLQVIIINCRSWRGEGMKMFTQLKFTYEQESHPEAFFIPYVWQLVLSTRKTLVFLFRCLGFAENAQNIENGSVPHASSTYFVPNGVVQSHRKWDHAQ